MNAMVGRLFASLEAETAQFDARMTASAAVVERMTRSTTIATRAAGQVRTGLQGLAMQAFATVGPLGQVASGLTQIAGGATALVGAAAGGAVFLWLNHITKQLEQATEKSEELAGTWRRMAAERIGSPLLTTMAAREPFENQRDDLVERIRAREEKLRGLVQWRRMGLSRLETDAQLQQMRSQLTSLNGILDEISRKPEAVLTGLRREVQLLNAPLEETLRLQAQWAGLVGDTADEFVRLGIVLATHPLKTAGDDIARQIAAFQAGDARTGAPGFDPSSILRMDQLNAVLEGIGSNVMGLVSQGRGGATRSAGQSPADQIFNELFAQEQRRLEITRLMTDETFQAQLAAFGLTEEFDALVRSMNRAEIKSQQLAIALVGAVSGAIQAIIGGGGIGSIVSGAGGILSSLATKHPALLLPGMILTSLGGIFNSADRANERRHRELMEETRRIRENTDRRGQPDHIQVDVFLNGKRVSDELVQDVMYGIRRMERRNAVPVLPSG